VRRSYWFYLAIKFVETFYFSAYWRKTKGPSLSTSAWSPTVTEYTSRASRASWDGITVDRSEGAWSKEKGTRSDWGPEKAPKKSDWER